jgi:hypothetical protein
MSEPEGQSDKDETERSIHILLRWGPVEKGCQGSSVHYQASIRAPSVMEANIS